MVSAWLDEGVGFGLLLLYDAYCGVFLSRVCSRFLFGVLCGW